MPVADLLQEGGHTASITIAEGVTILGGDIDIEAKAGILDFNSDMSPVAKGFTSGVEVVLGKYADLLALPLAVQISIVKATVVVGAQGGDAVTIRGAENVSIDAEATAQAEGDAIFWWNPTSKQNLGLAVGVWVAEATSTVTLNDQVSVESSEGNVSIAADSKTVAGGAARVSQNLDSTLGADGNGQPANPNNMALSVGVAVTTTTATVTVGEGASVIAETGNVAITSTGEDEVKMYPETRSYKDGKVGVTIGI